MPDDNGKQRTLKRDLKDVEGGAEDNLKDVEGDAEDNLKVVEGDAEDNLKVVEGDVEDNLRDVEGDVEDNLRDVEGFEDKNPTGAMATCKRCGIRILRTSMLAHYSEEHPDGMARHREGNPSNTTIKEKSLPKEKVPPPTGIKEISDPGSRMVPLRLYSDTI